MRWSCRKRKSLHCTWRNHPSYKRCLSYRSRMYSWPLPETFSFAATRVEVPDFADKYACNFGNRTPCSKHAPPGPAPIPDLAQCDQSLPCETVRHGGCQSAKSGKPLALLHAFIRSPKIGSAIGWKANCRRVSWWATEGNRIKIIMLTGREKMKHLFLFLF